MELVNAASKYLNETEPAGRDAAVCYRTAHAIVTMLAPICPHWAEELFHEALGREGSVYDEPWPEFDPDQAKSDSVEIVVQVKGKIRARIMVPATANKDELEAAAREAVADQIAGKDVKKVVVVPGKLVNIVAV